MSEQPGAADPFEVPDGTSPPPAPLPRGGVAGAGGSPYASPPYPQPTYASTPYTQPPYTQPPYAQPSYVQPSYAPPPWASSPPSGPLPPPAFAPPLGPRPRRGAPVYDEAQPYHRILRTRNYGWWRPVIGLVVLAITYLVLQTVVLSALLIPAIISGRFSLDDLSTDATSLTAELVSDPIGLAAATLAIATGIVAAALALLAGHQLWPGWLHSVVGRMRWGFLAACLGLGALAVITHLVASSIVAAVTGADDGALIETGQPQLLLALVALLLVPLQAAGEEYVFRGYALQALGAWFRRPWLPILLTSLVFSAAHLGDPASSLWFFMFGALAAYLTVRTGGLEAAIGLHVAWNTVTLLLLAVIGGDSGEAISSRSDSSWLLPLVSVPVFVAYTAAVLWLARRRGLDTTTRPTPAAPGWVQPQYVGSFGQPPGPR